MKKLISMLTSTALSLSLLASSGAQVLASIYETDIDEVYYDCVVRLNEQPLSKYPAAQENGVDEFIFTDEGKAVYDLIMEDHEFAKDQIAGLLGTDSLDIKYDYTAAYNGFSITLTHGEYKLIRDNAVSVGITGIYEVSPADSLEEEPEEQAEVYAENDPVYSYEELTDKVLDTVGVTASGKKGDGTVIAVIDTAFDRYHEFFTMPDGVEGSLKKEDISAVSPYLTANLKSAADYYVSNKIPFAFDYNEQSRNTLKNYDEHGTHVAGIAAGNGDAETDPKYNAKGVAPDAQLVLMSDISFGSENLIAAYDDSLYLGADVINASYGISGVNSDFEQCEAETEAINNITSTGVAFCAAAGNDDKLDIDNLYTDYSTGGHPNNIGSTLSVGCAENYFQEVSAILVNGNAIEITDSEESISEAFDGLTMDYVVVPGLGEASDYENIDVTGKIALVQRGTISFNEKAEVALAAGAVGLIVYNNEPDGSSTQMKCDGIPSGFISFSSGTLMAEQENKTVTFEKDKSVVLKYDKEVMSSFSSWDFTESLLLKPDITGFGGNIISSVPSTFSDRSYAPMSGTSMASPQLAGLSALLKQYLKENTEKYGIVSNSDYNELMAKLLMSTATPIGTSDGQETASPRVQGNGLANVEKAMNTPCYISSESERDNYRPKISLGEDQSGDYILNFNIHNVSDTPHTYTLNADVFSDAMEDGALGWNTQRLVKDTDYSISFTDANYGNEIQEITVEPYGVAPVTAEITISQTAYDAINEAFENGTFIDGFVRLTSENDPALTLSFMAFCGDWSEDDSTELIEQFAYKDPDNECGSYFSDGVNIAGSNYIEIMEYLGNMDMESGDSQEFVPTLSQPYFSPITDPNDTDKAFNHLFFEGYFKRRCSEVKIEIYDSAKNMVYSESLGSGETVINPETGERTPNMFEVGWDINNAKNNERYTAIVYAKTPLSDKMSSHVITQSFIIDTQKPDINKCSRLSIGGTNYLMIESDDNGNLQGAVSYEGEFAPMDYDGANIADSNQTLLVEIPEDSQESFVEVYDMAGNYETVNVSDVTQNISLDIDENMYFTSDESTFKNKVKFVDEDGNKVNISYDFSSTPESAYKNSETETTLIIDGAESVAIPVSVGLKGDANGDGKVNVRDASYIAAKLSDKSSIEYDEFLNSINGYCADYNDDNAANVRDAAAIARYLAGKFN